MGKVEEVGLDSLHSEIGEKLSKLNDKYILEYFQRQPGTYNKDVRLKITKFNDGGFNVYEESHGTCVTAIRKSGKKTYVVLPLGLARVLATDVLQDFRNNTTEKEFDESIFYTLFESVKDDSADALDVFLYYIGILFVDAYQLNPEHSNAISHERNYMLFDGQKDEFVVRDGGMEYEKVLYSAEFWHNKDKVKITKIYTDCDHGANTFRVSVDELIATFLNV